MKAYLEQYVKYFDGSNLQKQIDVENCIHVSSESNVVNKR